MIFENLDKNPEKLKILEYSKAPHYEYLILNYEGSGILNPENRVVCCVVGDWLNNTRTEPDNNFRKILRNRKFYTI